DALGPRSPASAPFAVLLETARLRAAHGDFPGARSALREAHGVARAIGRRGLVAESELEAARVHAARGDRAEALARARTALAEFRRSRARSVEALGLLAHLASQTGEHRRALRLFSSAEAAAGARDSLRLRLERAHARFVDRFRAGDAAGSLAAAREEVRLARESASAAFAARARVDAAEHLRHRGRVRAARRLYLRVLRETRVGPRLVAETRFRARLGLARLELEARRVDPASRRLAAAERDFRFLRRYPELADLRAAWGEAHLAAGRSIDAAAAFRAALRIDGRLDRPAEEADDLQGLARANLAGGRPEAAAACVALAEERVAAIPPRADTSARPGADLRARIEEVKADLAQHRRRARGEREVGLLRAIASLQRDVAETRVEALPERLARLAAERLRAERAYVFLDRRGGAALAAAITAAGEPLEPDAATLAAARRAAPDEAEPVPLLLRRTWLAAPMLRGGAPVGTLAVEALRLERRFDDRDRAELRSIAALAAIALGTALPAGRAAASAHEAISTPIDGEAAGTRIVGVSPAIRRIRRLIGRAATTEIPVLVRGETGAGKELVARAIHAAGNSQAPLVVVSCGTLSPSLAGAELFGHEVGAFSGAAQATPGLLERAEGGTLLLDGVEDLEPGVQKALLRVLESGEVRRLGGASARVLRFRCVATTSADLEDLVARGGFRADLYFRLRGLTIDVPPLRERREDVLPLAEHFLATLGGDAGPRLTPAAVRALLHADWPGNVRELRAEVTRWIVQGLSSVHRSDLAFEASPAGRARGDGAFAGKRADFERGIIEDALRRADGRPSQAARLLRMPRSTLYLKLRAYGLGASAAGRPVHKLDGKASRPDRRRRSEP
ncbi:MAG TPA: sigma 54-interacting transcriptional regulator, partial [Planctomycetota bacterium]|nr:sigma 54-interacting transcriptional regulator [Planctomycetota bacterium]